MRAVRASGPLMMAMVSGVIGTFFIVPHVALFPIYQRDILEVGASGLGLMFAASGIGALIVAFVLALTSSERPSLRLSLLMGALSGLFIAVFSQSDSFAVSLGVLVAVGAFSQGFFTLNMALVQWLAPAGGHGARHRAADHDLRHDAGGADYARCRRRPHHAAGALGVMGLLAVVPQIALMIRPRVSMPP